MSPTPADPSETVHTAEAAHRSGLSLDLLDAGGSSGRSRLAATAAASSTSSQMPRRVSGAKSAAISGRL